MSTRDGYGSSELVEPALNHAGLIIRLKGPEQSRNAFNQLGEFITPSELFYIRSHFPIAVLDPAAFRLSIRGAVGNELSLSYADLRAMPSWKGVATLKCAGNGRVSRAPPAPSTQWEPGEVGNAEWTASPFLCF
jgi:DMSO/TMAO reductase YedYZ molybdopterin-dependent catalytic subunit